jgi:putative ABC transport system permease protein
MGFLLQDLRFALRQLARDRGFALATVLTLTAGIGAAAAMLTLIDAVLLREIPYADSGRLVILEGALVENGETKVWPISEADFADWRKRNTVFTDSSVFGGLTFNLEQGEQSQRLWAELVNDRYFALLGLRASLGRFFTAEEDAKPLERYVVVLGYDLWRSSFGGDPAVLGRALRSNGRTFHVVGVGPPGFHGLSGKADLWVPSMVPPTRTFLLARGMRWLDGVARLRPGVTVLQAQRQMNGVTAALEKEFPDSNRGAGVSVIPLEKYWFGRLRTGILVLTLGAGIILLIACINVSSLLLTRAATRQRNFAIRIALGANRRRLVRQLLIESLLLTLSAAACGMLLAAVSLRALIASSGIQFPSFVHIAATPRVIAATVGLALLCGVVFGLAPLWTGFGAALAPSLGRDETITARGQGWRRFQRVVVVGQVALALVLSVDAALLAKSFRELVGEDLGFHGDDLLTFRMDPRGPKYGKDEEVVRMLRQEYLARIEAVPGVEKAALSEPTIPTDGWVGGFMTVEDHASSLPDGMYLAMWHAVTPAFFDLLRIPLLAGRGFTAQDTQSNAVVVSRSLASAQWPGQSAIGKRLKLGARASADAPWLTVVGVVADVRHEGLQRERSPAPDLYISLLQFIRRPPLIVNFLVRPKRGVAPDELRSALHREMMQIDPELPDYDVASLADRLSQQADKPRFELLLIVIFTLLAVSLATVGIYGAMAHGVEQRRREIAIRMSLGADRAQILRLVVGRGAAMAAIGLAVGFVALAALGRLLVDLLYRTSLTDPVILGGTALALLLATLGASYLPARRAARVDPVEGLRLQ